eukprot:TRINITY_DN12422_c0_g1_i1.p1 TRINITY_DN12422_c0_g1~~TRINITY_DN12422_c0_g1_i1.p1  ORF type:complete len:652 (+),score=72.35 TRINITY_DN12422_c0_g1_i1:68-2023(+)
MSTEIGLSEEENEQHGELVEYFGPVFVTHFLSDKSEERRMILKMLTEWVVEESTDLPGGRLVIRTHDEPVDKLGVLRNALSVCAQTADDPADDVFIQGTQLLKQLLGETKLFKGLKQADISVALKPVIFSLRPHLGNPDYKLRHKAFTSLLSICNRTPRAPNTSIVMSCICAPNSIKSEETTLIGCVYFVVHMMYAYGVKDYGMPIKPKLHTSNAEFLHVHEDALEEMTKDSASDAPTKQGLLNITKIWQLVTTCFDKHSQQLNQLCHTFLMDLHRLLYTSLEQLSSQLSQNHQQTLESNIGQYSPNNNSTLLTCYWDCCSYFQPKEPQDSGFQDDSVEAGGDEVSAEMDPSCKINLDMICKASTLQRRPQESTVKYLHRINHLSLQAKGIDEIGNLHLCKALKVLYLYDNHITTITNLNFAAQLTHLYLSNNQIMSLNGLQALLNLRKLYIDNNNIARLDSIGNLSFLEELHIAHQQFPEEDNRQPQGSRPSSSCSSHTPTGMVIDGETLYGLQRLQVLNVSGNNISDVYPLKHLVSIASLDLSANNLTDLDAIVGVVQQCTTIECLKVAGNPVTEKHGSKHFEALVLHSSHSLVNIDGKDVTMKEREFIKQLRSRTKPQPKRHGSSGSIGKSKTSFTTLQPTGGAFKGK